MLRIGHRGARGHAPENTLSGIERAIELAAEAVEIDVQITRDGELVLMHDKRVDRTTNGSGYVRELTLREIRNLDAGMGEHVPTLAEALDLARGRVELIVELIDPTIGTVVVGEVEKLGRPEEILYASFHHRSLLELRAIRPSSRTVALLEAVPVDHTGFVRDARATHVGLSIESLTPAFVKSLQEDQRVVLVYTVNDPRDVVWLSEIGVDGVISDFPEIVPVPATDRESFRPVGHGTRATGRSQA